LWEQQLGHRTLPLRIGEVFVPMILATLFYFGMAFALRVPYAQELMAFLRKRARL
jgi:hypothetical protein